MKTRSLQTLFSSSPLSTSWYLVAIAQYPRPADDLFDGGTQQQHLLVRSKSTEFVRDRKVKVDREEKEQHKWQPRRLVQRAKSTHWLHNM